MKFGNYPKKIQKKKRIAKKEKFNLKLIHCNDGDIEIIIAA